MHFGARSANVPSHNVQISAAFKEQQAINEAFDHVPHSQSVLGRAGFALSGTALLISAEDIAL
jgi:hypothetical protein